MWLTAGSVDTAHGWAHGLLLAAVAVVAQAVWSMRASLAPDVPRKAVALVAAAIALAYAAPWTQIAIIVAGAAFGLAYVGQPLAYASMLLMACVIVVLPFAQAHAHSDGLAMFDRFFRVGSFVFGGGHVVLPLLRGEVVETGWLDDAHFLAGYGAAQALPGPLFTVSAYLGAISHTNVAGWSGAILALLGIFSPSFLLIAIVVPFWSNLRAHPAFASALAGAGAAVVGILAAALYRPLIASSVHSVADAVIAIAALACLTRWKWPSWSVVGACALAAALART